MQLIEEPSQSEIFSSLTDTDVLDRSVEEVLSVMLGLPVNVAEDRDLHDPQSVTLTAVVGLAGALSGAYTVLVPAEAAIQMTACMVGMELNTVDETVLDGLGEIGNMLAGAWKSKVPCLNAACLLSVPTVVTGTHYEIHKKTSSFCLKRSYRFNDSVFTISIYGENP